MLDIMPGFFYVWTVDSHNLYGPFNARSRAYMYADKRKLRAYQVLSGASCQNICDPGSFHKVPDEDR